MRLSEYVVWFVLSFAGFFVVTVFFPENWPHRIKVAFRVVVGFLLFVLIGFYWLITGEKPDETFYRYVLCPLHSFERCNRTDSPRTVASASAVHPPISGSAPAKDSQETAELERLAKEALEREAKTRRLLLEQADRQRQEYEAQQRELQYQKEQQQQREQEREAERQREIERQNFLRAHKFGATAVGRTNPSGGLRAITVVDATSDELASFRAQQRCSELAINCKIIARFSGPLKCVYVAGGTTDERRFGRVVHHVGATASFSEEESLAKCRSEYASCSVFHVRCNSGLN